MDEKNPDLAIFSPSRFLADFKKVATAINAPYSETTLHNILEAYHQYLLNGAVIWRTTDRPGDALNFRFYTRSNVRNTNAIAVAGGFLKADNPMSPIIASWSDLYDNTTESCDFNAVKGLAKTWVYLGGRRPLYDILHARDMPESIRRHGPTFKGVGLNLVRHVCVDYESETVNIYFYAPGPISEDQAAQLVALAGSPPPSQDNILEMQTFLKPAGFTFAVTIDVKTGVVTRVAFYALRLLGEGFPKIGERLVEFFKRAPSYDAEEMNGVAWSFGKGGKRYIKGERSYCGQVVPLMRGWETPMTVDRVGCTDE